MRRAKMGEREYEQAKAFLAATWRVAFAGAHEPPPGLDPGSVLATAELTHPRQARAGLREAIDDILGIIGGWPPERIRALDADLAAPGLVTATQMLSAYSRRVQRLLKSKMLDDEQDCRLLQTILDAEPSGWSEAERQTAASLLNAFEARK